MAVGAPHNVGGEPADADERAGDGTGLLRRHGQRDQGGDGEKRGEDRWDTELKPVARRHGGGSHLPGAGLCGHGEAFPYPVDPVVAGAARDRQGNGPLPHLVLDRAVEQCLKVAVNALPLSSTQRVDLLDDEFCFGRADRGQQPKYSLHAGGPRFVGIERRQAAADGGEAVQLIVPELTQGASAE